MEKVVVLGSNLAGVAAALEIKKRFTNDIDVTIVSTSKKFLYVPSMTWVPLGHRNVDTINSEIKPTTENKNIHFINESSKRIYAEKNQIETENGTVIDYDYLVIAAGVTANYNMNANLNQKDGLIRCIITPDESDVKSFVLTLGYDKLKKQTAILNSVE